MGETQEKALSSERVQASFLAGVEKRALTWMAGRLPRCVSPDMLTLLGLLAMAGVGTAYFFSGRYKWCLILASVGLVVNWFGDSLDGTLARVRKQQRPKYGYYLDHLVDAFGTCFMLFGVAYSGLATVPVVLGFMAIYMIMSINTYLATQTVGVFKISFARLSPTEGRVFLIALNTLLIFVPQIRIGARNIYVLDIASVIAAVLLLVLTLRSAVLNLTALNRTERAAWTKQPGQR